MIKNINIHTYIYKVTRQMTNWQWGKYLKQMLQKVSMTGNQWKNICNQIFKCVKNKGTVYRIRTTNAQQTR